MASIAIEFVQNVSFKEGEGISAAISSGGASFSIFESFVPTRLTNNQSSIGGSRSQSALNLFLALNSDYGSTLGIRSVSLPVPTVVLITLDDGWTPLFAEANAYPTELSFTLDSTTVPPPDPLDFTFTISPGANPCTGLNVQLSPTGGTGSYDFIVNANAIPGTSYVGERGTLAAVRLRDLGNISDQVVKTVVIPQRYSAAHFNIDIVQRPTHATVTIQTIIPVAGITSLEYSLNNIDFTPNNTFSGQVPGDYTVWIRDNFGCAFSLPYTISDVSPEPLDPLFILPEANSLRFYLDEEDTCTTRPNYYNSKSCQEAVRGIAYQEFTFFEACDVVTTQFKTNHAGLTAKTVSPDGTEFPLAVLERVTNIGLRDARDCRYFRVDASHIGVFFDSGNTYDPDTLVANGTYAQINGTLPNFVTEGVFLNVQGLGFKEVISTEYDQTREVWYAKVLGSLLSTSTILTLCTTTYNRQPYNVYEIVIPMNIRLNTNFIVQIDTDILTYKSEEVRVLEKVKGTVIHYWNSENKFDMVYSSSPLVQHTLRIPEMDIVKILLDSELENYNSDNAPIQLDSKLYKNFELRVENIATATLFKIGIALSHDIVFVNGLEMTFKEISEQENIENTNLYNARFLMIEGGNAAQRQREQVINLVTLGAIRLQANLGLINYLS